MPIHRADFGRIFWGVAFLLQGYFFKFFYSRWSKRYFYLGSMVAMKEITMNMFTSTNFLKFFHSLYGRNRLESFENQHFLISGHNYEWKLVVDTEDDHLIQKHNKNFKTKEGLYGYSQVKYQNAWLKSFYLSLTYRFTYIKMTFLAKEILHIDLSESLQYLSVQNPKLYQFFL